MLGSDAIRWNYLKAFGTEKCGSYYPILALAYPALSLFFS
jgi:hypothetical protein